MDLCPCGSQENYESCCGAFHTQSKQPQTAEQLMRARYSAFAKNQISFIESTHMPGTTDFDAGEAQEWATSSQWKGLKIIQAKNDVVEFQAHYADKEGKDYLHHEIAKFKRLEDIWYYEDGQIVGTGPLTRQGPKIGRNEPCPCGSGKKFKKCCGG